MNFRQKLIRSITLDRISLLPTIIRLSLTLLALSISVFAQDGDSCKLPTVKVGFTASMCSHNPYTITLSGTQVTGTGDCTAEQWVTSALKYAALKVDETYTLTVGADSCSTHINFVVPDGYKLEIDGIEAKSIDKFGTTEGGGDGSWNVVLRKKCPCGSEGPGESPGPKRGSVLWAVGMGSLSDGTTAHSINLREEALSAAVYTPAALIYSPPGRTSEVDVVRNGDESLRQVKAPQALADIVVISSTEYEIRYYRAADVGAKSGGLYPVTGPPFVTWRIKNPDPTLTTRLQILKTQGAVTETSEYTWDAISDSWTLSTGNGAIIETSTITYPTQTSRVETIVIKDNSSVISSKISNTYHTFAWGEELIQEVLDPDGAALKTVYSYYENQSETGKYSRLKSVINPDGSWEKYDYDSAGNTILVLRPWKDQTIEAATEDNSYAIRYTYSNSDGIITSLYTNLLSSETEKIGGVIVRKTTYSRLGTTVDGHPAVVETQTSYSSASEGLVTRFTRYHDTAPPSLANRIVSVEHPDGRKESLSYEKGNYVPNANPALSTFTLDANGLAERETMVDGTIVAPLGIAFKTTKKTSIRDQYGKQVLRETLVFTGADYERIAWTSLDYDDRGHLIMSHNHKGEVATAVWTGDQKTSETDASGIETNYTYNSLNRVKTKTKKGIAAGGGFPAQTDVVTELFYDAVGHLTRETVTGVGDLSLTSERIYDRAGRISKETDQAQLSTIYSYSNGGRTQTVTMPGGATEVADKYLDGQAKSISGSTVVALYFDYGVNADGTRYTQEFVGNAGLTSPRWSKSTTDWMGRVVSVEKPSFTGTNVIEGSTYNTLNQLQKRTRMAGTTKLLADTLFEYELGQVVRAGLDVDANGTLGLVSIDRITERESVFEKVGSDWFRVTATKTYLTDNNSTPVTQTRRERLNNFPLNGTDQTVAEVIVTDVTGNTAVSTIAIDRAAKRENTTIDTPDSDINSVSISVNQLLQSSTPTTAQSPATYAYDALGRQIGVSHPITGSTSRTFNSNGQLATTNDGAGTTTFEYYPAPHFNAGRLKSEANAVGKKVYFAYNSRGELLQTWGDSTYPQEYVYDAYGQQTELHTFRGGQNWTASVWPASTTGTADVTKWIFQESSGVITQRLDAFLKGITYTYDELGHLKTLMRARGVSSTLGYDGNTGELRTLTYSDGTPAVSFTYDRGGRQSSITDAAGSRARTFTLVGQLQTEQITGGILDGVAITVGHNGFLRRSSLQISQGANTLSSQTYGYDAAARLETITSGTQTATYIYHTSTGQLSASSFTGGTGIGRTYDSIGRLETITTTPAAGGTQSYAYTYNNLNQRTRVTREDGSYWSYVYNDRGELIAGKKFWSDNSIVWGAQTEYSLDNIGNRKYARSGGNQLSLLRESNYTANSLNQYSQRNVPGAIDVAGTANTSANVAVNNQATVRKGEYFYKELVVDNSAGPVSQQIHVIGARNNFGPGGEDAVTEKGGRELLPAASEAFTYDDDGNLLTDGRWVYTWDAADRLTSVESLSSVLADAKQRLEFVYDFMGRRIQKKTYIWNAGTSSYQLSATTRFVNDDWNLVAELDESNVAIRSFTWGLDGLLLIKQGGKVHQVSTDANENVVMLVNAGTGVTSATYDYDAFGVQIKSTGEFASSNPFRFSMKYFDSESGLQYYGLRYYRPETGRWINRDPSKELGGLNVYGFINNDGVNAVDYLGLWKREADWTGGWYNYSGTVIAECGDTLTKLADLITGDENDWITLGIPDKVQVGQKVNIAPLLRAFEHKLRYRIVAATEKFNAAGFYAPSTLVGPSMTAAINKYFTEEPFGQPDCLTATRLVMAKGVIDTLKSNEFDELELADDNVPTDTKKGTLGSMLVGDAGWIRNYPDYLDRHPTGGFQAENVIKVHHNRFWGFVGSNAYLSEAGWERKLRAEYNKGHSNNRTDRIPGFDGEVKFVHVPNLTMRVFDLRKKKKQ